MAVTLPAATALLRIGRGRGGDARGVHHRVGRVAPSAGMAVVTNGSTPSPVVHYLAF